MTRWHPTSPFCSLRTEAPFALPVLCDCSLEFGPPLPPEGRMRPALSLFFITVSLATIGPAVAKESHDMCEEIQVFRGVQDTSAFPGRLFFYPISPFAFHGTITHYKVTLANGSVLPKWLEYNRNTSTLQGLPMLEESGEYHLTVAAHGGVCAPNPPAATASFALHVHNYITVSEKQTSTNQKPLNDNICSGGQCARDISLIFAEIIICHTAGSLTIQERLSLIYAMAEYLHLDPSFLTLIPFKESFNQHLWNLTVLSEDTKYISTVENHYVGLCWPVEFGVFAMLYELVQVLQHNVQSSHLSQLLGYEIAGWRILQKGSHERKHVGRRHRRKLMVTPSPALRPTKIGVKPTKMEAFTFWSTALLHTKSPVRPSASSSSLYKDSGTAVPSYPDIPFHSITSQRDLATLHVLSIHSRLPAFTFSPSLSSADPDLSPSLTTTASLTEFGREDNLSSKTPPISEIPESQVQDTHFTPGKSEPKPHFFQYYLSFSVPASKPQASRPVQHTVGVSVSQEDTPSEKRPVSHFPKEFVTDFAHSSPYAHLTTSGLALEDIFFTADLPLLSTTSTLAKRRFPFLSEATSLFLSGCSHQNQDLFSHGRDASESIMSSLQMKENVFMEENSPSLPAVLTETTKCAVDSNLMDVPSTPDSATTGSTSVHELGLAPDSSPVPQLYYSGKTPALTTYSTQEFTISLFTSLVEFGLFSRTSSTPTEIPSLPLSTSKELAGSFSFHNISPMEELWPSSRFLSQKVFKMDESTSGPFITVPQTNRLFSMKDRASALITMHVETPLWNEPCCLIYITTSGVVLSSQFLSVDSLSQSTSQTYSWYSYDTLLLSLPVESVSTPTLPVSMSYFSSYASGIRVPVACPDVLQWETSDLILASPLGTKAAFPITRQLTSKLLEELPVTSLQAEFHATSVSPGVQGQPNTSPTVVNAINWITATIGHKFSFSIPPDTFYDQEDGDTSQLTLGMSPVDGSPLGPENWLHFNSHFQTMHGYPLANDFQYSPQEFLLFATDSEGLKTSDMLTIELLRPSAVPCHNYTVRTKNSYHSFLREREKVYLFFEKLSKYLSCGSPGSMRLLCLRAGSTRITWYDNSFCSRSSRCARDEIQGVLVKLRLPGGNVNPDFVKAMLPEYTIYQTEDVAYGGTCSSNESLISNQTITALKVCHPWSRTFFLALLISICAAIMIILIMIFCCKHKKIIGSQSMSFHGKSFLEMDVLKSHRSATLEQEAPWPTELRFPVPTQSQQHSCRPSANLAASRLPPPPKYRLPPLYGLDEPRQTWVSHKHLKSNSKARLY